MSETRKADHKTTLDQIGTETLDAVNARNFIHDDPNGMVMFQTGNGRGSVRKIIVQLMSTDTYTVIYGHMPICGAHSYEWITDHELADIHADQLSDTVYDLVKS